MLFKFRSYKMSCKLFPDNEWLQKRQVNKTKILVISQFFILLNLKLDYNVFTNTKNIFLSRQRGWFGINFRKSWGRTIMFQTIFSNLSLFLQIFSVSFEKNSIIEKNANSNSYNSKTSIDETFFSVIIIITINEIMLTNLRFSMLIFLFNRKMY